MLLCLINPDIYKKRTNDMKNCIRITESENT